MAHQIVHPASTEEAIAWLTASPVCFDSPTHHRYRTRDHLDRVFGNGIRHPDLVWAARDGERVVAVVAALSFGDGAVLDHLGAGPDDALDALVAAATADLAALPEAEAGIYLPPGASVRKDAADWTARLEASGWRLLVERHHYEFDPEPGLGTLLEGMTLRQAASTDEVAPLYREVMRETLDVHDRHLIEQVGFDDAVTQGLENLVDADPVEAILLAYDEGDPEPVAMVSRTLAGDRGYVNFVGVAARARGRGLGRRLLDHATAELIGRGATTLIADTDHDNLPMAAAFAAAGWPVTEVRADFVR